MSKKPLTNKQRRKLLKSAVIGSGVVGASGLATEKWAKPIINSVILPAHAQTTETDVAGKDKTTTTTTTTQAPAPLDKFSLVEMGNEPDEALLSSSSITKDKSPSILAKLGEILIPAAHAQSSSIDTVEFYLEELASGAYRFVFLDTGKNSGNILTARYVSGELTIGSSTSLTGSSCFYTNTGNFSVDVTLVSVTLGVSADINLPRGTFTLLFDPNATPPSNVTCFIPPTKGSGGDDGQPA